MTHRTAMAEVHLHPNVGVSVHCLTIFLVRLLLMMILSLWLRRRGMIEIEFHSTRLTARRQSWIKAALNVLSVWIPMRLICPGVLLRFGRWMCNVSATILPDRLDFLNLVTRSHIFWIAYAWAEVLMFAVIIYVLATLHNWPILVMNDQNVEIVISEEEGILQPQRQPPLTKKPAPRPRGRPSFHSRPRSHSRLRSPSRKRRLEVDVDVASASSDQPNRMITRALAKRLAEERRAAQAHAHRIDVLSNASSDLLDEALTLNNATRLADRMVGNRNFAGMGNIRRIREITFTGKIL